jgi:hypothetical protein
MGAGLSVHPLPECPRMRIQKYDINPMRSDVKEISSNDAPLADLPLGGAAFVLSADSYGRVKDMRTIVRRDVAHTMPGECPSEHKPRDSY